MHYISDWKYSINVIDPDGRLIDRLKKGDEIAFRELVEQYEVRVYNTCLGFVKNNEEADDLSQEVFLEIYSSIQNFRGDARLSTWIYRIAVTKSLELLRSRKRKKRFAILKSLFASGNNMPIEIPSFEHPGIQAENKERSIILFQAIDRLPESQKTAFTLHKVEGLSYEEVGNIMGKSVSSVESLMHRARTNLRLILGAYYHNHL
jgi:RNA polymerase sigma-70 factor (ECF subfamily)